MNFDNLQQKGWKDYSQGALMEYGLDMILVKRHSLYQPNDYYIAMKRFEVLDAKELMVWHSKVQIMSKRLLKEIGCFIYIILVAEKLSADALLMIKTGTLNLAPKNSSVLIVLDEENDIYYGEFRERYYKEAEKILFGR